MNAHRSGTHPRVELVTEPKDPESALLPAMLPLMRELIADAVAAAIEEPASKPTRAANRGNWILIAVVVALGLLEGLDYYRANTAAPPLAEGERAELVKLRKERADEQHQALMGVIGEIQREQAEAKRDRAEAKRDRAEIKKELGEAKKSRDDLWQNQRKIRPDIVTSSSPRR